MTITEQPTAPTEVAARWRAALADFHASMGRRLAASTCDRIENQVRRFARETGHLPYDVTAADLTTWLDALTCSQASRYAYRTSLRTFYRWAHRAGRIPEDPSRHEGPHPLARPVPAPWPQVLRDFTRWQQAASYSPETIALYRDRLASLARQTGCGPWELTTDDLTDWMAGHKWGRETTRAHRTTLRTFYRWAHESGRIDENPTAKLPKVRPTSPAPRPATEDAYHGALAQADERTGLMIRLAAELGLRRAEVAQIHAADLDRDSQGHHWLLVHGKGRKPRRVPVPRDLASALRARGEGYAFPGGDHGHLTPRRVGELVSELLPEGVTMHALRHRFATRVYAIDRDVFTLQRLLGHERADTTQRYVQTDADAMRRLVDLANAASHLAPMPR